MRFFVVVGATARLAMARLLRLRLSRQLRARWIDCRLSRPVLEERDFDL
jgi:hypothetical protein